MSVGGDDLRGAGSPAHSAPCESAGPFADFYKPGSAWGGSSGPGSSAYHTIEYRAYLQKFLAMNQITSVIDIGCGDWRFSQHVDFSGIRYIGLDVVPEVIDQNQHRFGGDNISFRAMPDDLRKLPEAQLVIVKDVLQHLSNQKILEFRELVFERYPFSLITNSFEKLNTPKNIDIRAGQFRCLDLLRAPYHFRGAYVLEFGSRTWENSAPCFIWGSPCRNPTRMMALLCPLLMFRINDTSNLPKGTKIT